MLKEKSKKREQNGNFRTKITSEIDNLMDGLNSR